MSSKLKAKWWGWLARRKASKGDYRSALIYRRRILSLFPQSSYAHSYVGYCYMGLEQYDEAMEAFDRALQNYGVGLSHWHLCEYQQAIDASEDP